MPDPKRLCLNMIVKNETANLERCLTTVADHISCWVIGDTGSTDGTQEFIRNFFAKRNIPGELHSFPFENFEQARNAALDHAYASPLQYDYLLFDDADMELVVDDPSFRDGLTAPGYRLLQRTSGGLSYWNTRLLRRDTGTRYHGVTHEYVDVPGEAKELKGAWYRDHASGANRVDKFERDIRLLKTALEREPNNGRYWFYLAQSYRDAGRLTEAADTYARRAEMGGWEEEAWMARLQQARCLRGLGDEAGFVSQALRAFNQRPQRAEPLYDLARYYRDQGQNHAAVTFAEFGLTLQRPKDDILFIEDFVYDVGLREEFSIAANYATDPARKDRGFVVCNALALDRGIGNGPRELAWSNLYFYARQAKTEFPSFQAEEIKFTSPEGYRPLNPSVCRAGNDIFVSQRVVNYRVNEDGLQYQTLDEQPVKTRNFLLQLDDDLSIRDSAEILPPKEMPAPLFGEVLGFEDLRLFSWRGSFWGISCVRELNPEGWCEQVIGRLERDVQGTYRLSDWRRLQPDGPRSHQKNWMPQVAGDTLQFVYLCDPTRILDTEARTVRESVPKISANYFRGGSQLIPFDGGWLALIHEVQWREAERKRYYFHRFVLFDSSLEIKGVSRPFYFVRKGVEFAAGLCWHPDERRLIISFSVSDSETWLATVDADEVRTAVELGDRSECNRLDKGPRVEIEPAEPIEAPGMAREPIHINAQGPSAVNERSTKEIFLELAPFLSDPDSPARRREQSRVFDARIAPFLDVSNDAALPQIHCFHEVVSDTAEHGTLIAAISSMRAAGHPVRVWTYSPEKLAFLRQYGADIRSADDVVPKRLFERILGRSEIRYFSDVFRYAVLYEHGGLWMDSDVILLRPFPFRGDHFFNLQWHSGAKGEHFLCGNVMYAEPFSAHMRALYEQALALIFSGAAWEFGAAGPKLLSDYIASDAGAPLRERVFSPMFFNAVDWNEIGQFERPVSELADYLNDGRVFGIHLWTARNPVRKGGGKELISVLSDPSTSLPSLIELADRFNTDKNRHTGNRHAYARVYERLLSSRRFSLRRLMEIGLCRGLAEGNQTETPSVTLWQTYFPFSHVTGVDLTDFSSLNNERFTSHICDQSNREQLRALASKLEPGSFDVIIDDGSHASIDEQQTLVEFFPLLANGGWYFIEDLDWQPPGEDPSKIALTKILLREIADDGKARSIDPFGISGLVDQIDDILFFDSQYELNRANLLGGLVAIRKRADTRMV